MSLIYEPRGKAREYSPLALNVYSGGCDHACTYCYCGKINKGFGKPWTRDAKPRDLNGLAKESAKASSQILLSFMGDPYCAAETQYRNTRLALGVLHQARCSVAILTKGGTRCLVDLPTFSSWPDRRIKIGATLTFNSSALSRLWEPGAADPGNRVEALRKLHEAGIKTWASIEPVIIASESLAIIEASLPYVDAYKVGRWNHDKRSNVIDWQAFGISAIEMIRKANKKLYVKVDLRDDLPKGFLQSDECKQDALSLPDRPTTKTLFA